MWWFLSHIYNQSPAKLNGDGRPRYRAAHVWWTHRWTSFYNGARYNDNGTYIRVAE